MFVELQKTDGITVAVNPAHIRRLMPYGAEPATIVQFDADDFIVVATPYPVLIHIFAQADGA